MTARTRIVHCEPAVPVRQAENSYRGSNASRQTGGGGAGLGPAWSPPCIAEMGPMFLAAETVALTIPNRDSLEKRRDAPCAKIPPQNARSRPENWNSNREPGRAGGEGEIRTHGTLARTTVFETVPIDHSGTSPRPDGLYSTRSIKRKRAWPPGSKLCIFLGFL